DHTRRYILTTNPPRRVPTQIGVDGPETDGPPSPELAAASRRLAAEGANRLALQPLLGAAGSSPAAAAGAVRRFSDRHVDAAWQALAQSVASGGTSRQEAALVDLLRRHPDAEKRGFVHYRD